MYKQRITNNRIQELKPDEIFVFGSNLAGAHGGGAALLAYRKWGAVWGKVLVTGVNVCYAYDAWRCG